LARSLLPSPFHNKYPPTLKQRKTMLSWAITFFVIAIIAGIIGFGGIAAGAAGIAKILFFLFLVLFVGSLIAGRKGTIR
jgi:uncharacterized membrane protein YtjA (UPF0391 family)